MRSLRGQALRKAAVLTLMQSNFQTGSQRFSFWEGHLQDPFPESLIFKQTRITGTGVIFHTRTVKIFKQTLSGDTSEPGFMPGFILRLAPCLAAICPSEFVLHSQL